MNRFFRRSPFRIFYVEDEPTELADLVRFLQRPSRFPRAEIITADNRLQAREAINASKRNGQPFDCAILDLKIPDHKNGKEYASADVAEQFIARPLFASQNPAEIWVLHSTAIPEHPEIAKFQAFLGKKGVVHEVVSKLASDSTERIQNFLERALIEKALGRLLDHPFFSTEIGGETWAVTVRNSRRPRPPMNLVAMAGLLVDSWKDLSDYRREQALLAFAGTELEITAHDETAGLKYEKTRLATEAWLEEADRMEDPR